MPKNLTELTFSDWNITDGEYTFKNVTTEAAENIGNSLFSGYVMFKENGTPLMYGGKDPWQGFRIQSNGANLSLDYIDASQTAVTIDASKAGVGETFLNKKFLLQMTTEVVDSDNDGAEDDVKFGLWIDGVLYNNEYFTFADASSKLGNRIFLASGKAEFGSYVIDDGPGEGPTPPEPAEKLPTGLTKLTFSDWNIGDGEYTFNNVSTEKVENIGNTLFSGYVTFEENETPFMYGGKEPWQGFRITMKSSGDLTLDYIDANQTAVTIEAGKAGVGETFLNKEFLLQMTTEVVDSDNDGATDDVKFGLWIDGVLYNNEYFTFADASSKLGNRIFLASGKAEFSSYIEAELPKNLTELTFSDWNITDGEYTFKNVTTEAAENIGNSLFSGYVMFKENGTPLMYGGKDPWQGFRIQSNGANLSLDYIDASQTAVTIDASKAGVGETFLNKKFLLQMTTEVVDSDNDGAEDDVKFGLWIDGVLYNNEYFTFADASSKLGKRIFLASGKAEFGSYVIDDGPGVGPTPPGPAEKLPTGLIGTTFSDWNIENGTYDFLNKTYGTSVAETLFTGYVTFKEDGTALMYGGKEPWQGFRLDFSGGQLKFDFIDAGQTPMELNPETAGVGDTFLNKRFLLQMTTQVVDSDNDGATDDVKFGLWIDGKLYNNQYFTYENASSFLGSRIFIPGKKLLVESDPNHVKPPVDLPPTQQPDEGLTVITFSNFGIKDGDYTAFEPKDFWVSGRYRDMENGYTLDNTLFKGKVKFSADGVTRIYYGGFQNNAWGGVAIFADGEGNLVVADTKEGATYAKLIEPQNAGCTLTGEWVDIMMSTQYVDNDNDGKKDDLKFGLWLNGRLYLDEYIYIDDLGGLMGSFMGLYGPVEESAISVRSDASVDSKISLAMYGFGDDYEKQFKPEASNRIEGKPQGVASGIFSGDATVYGTIMTGLLLSVAAIYFVLRRRRSL